MADYIYHYWKENPQQQPNKFNIVGDPPNEGLSNFVQAVGAYYGSGEYAVDDIVFDTEEVNKIITIGGFVSDSKSASTVEPSLWEMFGYKHAADTRERDKPRKPHKSHKSHKSNKSKKKQKHTKKSRATKESHKSKQSKKSKTGKADKRKRGGGGDDEESEEYILASAIIEEGSAEDVNAGRADININNFLV